MMTEKTDFHKDPFVTIIVPCCNEAKFIESCLDSILDQTYPKDRYEILVVDGMSEDGTRELVKKYSERFSLIKLLDNVNKRTPFAFNLGIKNAQGDVILIMGAHTRYSSNYISVIAHHIKEGRADCVGSVAETRPATKGFFAPFIVTSISSAFGVGNSYMRTGIKKPRYVDTASCPGYGRHVFEKIGFFNEKLLYSQDIEFSMRLKKAGLRFLCDPSITSYYYARSNIKSFLKHNYRNGLWTILPFAYSDFVPITLRHVVPLAFVLSLLISFAGGLFSSYSFYLGLLIAMLYASCTLFFSAKVAIQKKKWCYVFIMPVVYALLHVSYGLGSCFAIPRLLKNKVFWKKIFRRKQKKK